MSDSIFDYPDNVELKPRKQIQPDYQSRKIVIRQAGKKKSPYTFNKATFDYNFMFMDLAPSQLSYISTREMRSKFTQSDRRPRAPKNRNQQQLTILEDSLSQKSNPSRHDERILDQLKVEDEVSHLQPANQVVINQQQPSNHHHSSAEQIPNQTSQIVEESQKVDMPNPKVEQFQGIQNSQIDGLSADFQNGFQNNESKQEQQYQEKKQEAWESNPSFQINSFKKQLEIEGSLQISSIKPNKEGEDILELLNKFEEHDSDMDEPENKQDLEQKLEREEKILQMKSLPFRNLVYTLNTTNCRKIVLKSVVDFDRSPLKINKPKPVNYLSISQRKLQICSYDAENIIWQVANAKRQMEPLQLTVKCYSCGTKRKNALIIDRSCLALCTNNQCTKQITVQFVDISLSQSN